MKDQGLRLLLTIDFPDADIVFLINMALDDDVGTILVAEDNLNPPFVGTMLDELRNLFGSAEQLRVVEDDTPYHD